MSIRFDFSSPNRSANVIKPHLVVLNWLQLFCQMVKTKKPWLNRGINPATLVCCLEPNQPCTNKYWNIWVNTPLQAVPHRSTFIPTVCPEKEPLVPEFKWMLTRRAKESLSYFKQKAKGLSKKDENSRLHRSPVAVYVTPLWSCSLVIQGSID